MSRLVLLGLGDDDVDVLSRLARLDPRPDVFVFHPQDGALILRLAAISEWPAATVPPEPREDDVAVIPAATGSLITELVDRWRELGARVVSPVTLAELSSAELEAPVEMPESIRAIAESASEAPVTETVESAMSPVTPLPESEPELAPDPEPVSEQTLEPTQEPTLEPTLEPTPEPTPEPDSKVEPMAQTEHPATKNDASAPAANADNGLATPPADVWASPEATFRYLIEQTLGADASVGLYWNGATDVWVPWTWTGDTPDRDADMESGVSVPMQWGEMRVLGEGTDRLNMGALQRVAEDIALRDLMQWRETSRSLGQHGRPSSSADAGQLAAWLEPVWGVLNVQAALTWRRSSEGWSLMGARGSGLNMSGVFNMPERLLEATFEGPGSPWTRWEPADGLRLHLASDSVDPRLPLRLRRVELAVSGEDATR